MWHWRHCENRRPDSVPGENADADDFYFHWYSCHRGTFLYIIQYRNWNISDVETDLFKVIQHTLSYVYMHLRWVTEWRREWLSGHLQKNDINIFDLSLLLEIVLRALYNTVKLSLIINSRLSFVWSKVNHSLRKQISEQKLHIPCCWVYARPLHLSRTSIQFSQCRLIRTERRPRSVAAPPESSRCWPR